MYGNKTSGAAILTALLGWMGGPRIQRGPVVTDRLDGVDIDAEYELIKKKESKLPRALRDRIVAMKEADDGTDE
jgi:hypothetical protein